MSKVRATFDLVFYEEDVGKYHVFRDVIDLSTYASEYHISFVDHDNSVNGLPLDKARFRLMAINDH